MAAHAGATASASMKECITKVTGRTRCVSSLRSPTVRTVRADQPTKFSATAGCLATTRASLPSSNGIGVPEKLTPPRYR